MYRNQEISKGEDFILQEAEELMTEKRGLLARINYEKNESKSYTDAIQLDAEKVYSYAFVLM